MRSVSKVTKEPMPLPTVTNGKSTMGIPACCTNSSVHTSVSIMTGLRSPRTREYYRQGQIMMCSWWVQIQRSRDMSTYAGGMSAGPDPATPLWRAAQVFRLLSCIYALGFQIAVNADLDRPALGWSLFAVLIAW